MKKLLIIIAIMAVTAISKAQSYPTASIGCEFRFSEGMRASRVYTAFDWQFANVSCGISGSIPTSKYPIWGANVHIGPSFKCGKYCRINTEVVLGIDQRHFSPGGAIHVRWLVIGPLGVFGRVQCTCPLEFDPVRAAGQPFTSMTVGLFVQKKARRYPVWDTKH